MSAPSLAPADLLRIQALRGLPHDELETLLADAPVVQLRREEQLSEEGQPAGTALLLVSGLLRVFVTQSGTPVLVGEIWPGEICGEEALFHIGEPPERGGPKTSAAVIAAVNSVAVQLTPELLERARGTRTLARLQAHAIRTLAERIQNTNLGMRKAWLELQVREPVVTEQKTAAPARKWWTLGRLLRGGGDGSR